MITVPSPECMSSRRSSERHHSPESWGGVSRISGLFPAGTAPLGGQRRLFQERWGHLCTLLQAVQPRARVVFSYPSSSTPSLCSEICVLKLDTTSSTAVCPVWSIYVYNERSRRDPNMVRIWTWNDTV